MDFKLLRFDSPLETRTFEKGRFEVLKVGGMTLGRATYEPGWKWSEHVGGPESGSSCMVEHVGMVISGRAMVRGDNGTEIELSPGDVFWVGPGHDSWVIGDEPYVSLHFLGAEEYAASKG